MSAPAAPFPEPKPRPSWWWLVVGAALLLAAIPAFVWFLIQAIDGFAGVEAHIPADGAVHQVTVTAEEEKFLWVQEDDAADCQIRDQARGAAVSILPVAGPTPARTPSRPARGWPTAGSRRARAGWR